jgi:hypothetical protein
MVSFFEKNKNVPSTPPLPCFPSDAVLAIPPYVAFILNQARVDHPRLYIFFGCNHPFESLSSKATISIALDIGKVMGMASRACLHSLPQPLHTSHLSQRFEEGTAMDLLHVSQVKARKQMKVFDCCGFGHIMVNNLLMIADDFQ